MAARKKINNIARKKSVTVTGAAQIAQQQIWQREFNSDYDQIVKRVSTAVFSGLKFGQPPGKVGE